MMTIFGAMIENTRLCICGYYIMYELSFEMIDAGMSWIERRQPLYEKMIERAFSEEDKKAETRDENGRELPQWLKEAEEKEVAEKAEKYTKYSKKTIFFNYFTNYGLKLYMLFYYSQTFPSAKVFTNSLTE